MKVKKDENKYKVEIQESIIDLIIKNNTFCERDREFKTQITVFLWTIMKVKRLDIYFSISKENYKTEIQPKKGETKTRQKV